MASKKQLQELEAFKNQCWELIKQKEKLPENTNIPWRIRNENGDTLAHIYATYAVLPDSFSEWKLRSDRNGQTVAEVAAQYYTLPDSFDRYDMFPNLFSGHSLAEVKKEFDNIPSLKNDINVLNDELDRMRKENVKLESVEKELRKSLSDRIEKSVEQTSAELAAEREKNTDILSSSYGSLIELGILGGVTLVGLLAIYLQSKQGARP